jgi:rhomboid protease GluP
MPSATALHNDGPTRWPRATTTLCGLVALCFALQLRIDAAQPTPLQLIQLGSASWWLVLAGEPFRLLTALFLHGGWLHVLPNLLLLACIGFLLERIVGAAITGLVAVVSGVAGIAAQIALSDIMVVGSSCIYFGYLGAYSVFAAPTPSRRWALLALTPLIVLIDWLTPLLPSMPSAIWGHAAGLLAGTFVALPIQSGALERIARYATPGRLLAASLGVAIPVAAWGIQVLADQRSTPTLRAREFLLELVENDPQSADAHAALGQLLAHEGELDGALEARRSAFRLEPNAFSAHALVHADEAAGSVARRPALPVRAKRNPARGIILEIDAEPYAGCTLEWVAEHRAQPIGLLSLALGIDARGGVSIRLPDEAYLLSARWTEISRHCTPALRGGRIDGEFFGMHSE